jgi:hypothetical protein
MADVVPPGGGLTDPKSVAQSAPDHLADRNWL